MFTKDPLPADGRSDRNSSDYNHLKGLKTTQISGSASYPTSLKPISKFNILQSYFECNFNADSSRSIAQELKRQMKFSIKDSSHLDELRNKIIYLHNYNMKVAEISVTYPFSTELSELLLQYVLMESRTLYRRHYYTGRNEIKAQDRILRLLLAIYNAYFESKLVPAKKTFEKSAKAIINIFIEIRRNYGLNNDLLENMTKILLKKMGHLEKIEALTGKSLPCPLDTCLKNDPVFEIYKNIATSDYGTDDGSSNGFQMDDETDDIQIVSETAESSKETDGANEEHPHPTDDISQTLSRPVLTICLDYCGPGSDEEIECIAEEVKPTAEQEKKVLERTRRLLAIQEENQKISRRRLYRIQEEFRERNHKPMVDVKGEDEKFDQFEKGGTCLRTPFSLDESVMISGGLPDQVNPSKAIPELETFEISDEDECADGNSFQTDITIDVIKYSSSNSIKIQSNKIDDVLDITETDDEDVQAQDTPAIVEKNEEEIYDSFTNELAGNMACQLNSRQECTSENGISTGSNIICGDDKYSPMSLKPNDEAESSIIEIIDETVSDIETSEEDNIMVLLDSSDDDNIEGKVDESPSSKNESAENLLQAKILSNDTLAIDQPENIDASDKTAQHSTVEDKESFIVSLDQVETFSQIKEILPAEIDETDQSKNINLSNEDPSQLSTDKTYESICAEPTSTVFQDQVEAYNKNYVVGIEHEMEGSDVDYTENSTLTRDVRSQSFTVEFEKTSTGEDQFPTILQDQVETSSGIQEISVSNIDSFEHEESSSISADDNRIEKSTSPMDELKNISETGKKAQLSIDAEEFSVNEEISANGIEETKEVNEYESHHITANTDDTFHETAICADAMILQGQDAVSDIYPANPDGGNMISAMSMDQKENFNSTSNQLSTVVFEASTTCEEVSPAMLENLSSTSSDDNKILISTLPVENIFKANCETAIFSTVENEVSNSCDEKSSTISLEIEGKSAAEIEESNREDDYDEPAIPEEYNKIKVSTSLVVQLENVDLTNYVSSKSSLSESGESAKYADVIQQGQFEVHCEIKENSTSNIPTRIQKNNVELDRDNLPQTSALPTDQTENIILMSSTTRVEFEASSAGGDEISTICEETSSNIRDQVEVFPEFKDNSEMEIEIIKEDDNIIDESLLYDHSENIASTNNDDTNQLSTTIINYGESPAIADDIIIDASALSTDHSDTNPKSDGTSQISMYDTCEGLSSIICPGQVDISSENLLATDNPECVSGEESKSDVSGASILLEKPQISDNETESDLGEQQTHLKSTELEPKYAIDDSQSETGMDVPKEAISEEQVIVELSQEIHAEDSFTTNQKILTSQSDTKSSEKTTHSLSEDQSVLENPSEVVSISENPSGEFKEGKPQISDNETESGLGEQHTHSKSTEWEPECAIYDSRSETGMDVSIEAISEDQVIVELTQEIHTEDSFTTNQKILTSQSDTKSSEKTTDSLSEDQSVLVDPSEVVSISENPSGEFKEGKPQISNNDTESDLGEQQTHLKSTELEPECANYDSRSETGMDVSIEAISEEQVIVELTQEIHNEDSFTTNQKIFTFQSDTKSSEKTTDSLSEDQSVLVDPSEVVSISENPSGEFKEGKPQISDNDTESDLGEQQTHLKSTELEPECAIYDSRSETGMDVSIEAISEEQVIVELSQEIHTEDSFTTNQKILTSQSDTKSSEKTTHSLSEDQSVLVDPSEVVSISENPSGEFKEGKPQISDNDTESDLGEQQTHLKSTELEPECAIYDSRSETGMDVSIEAISEEQVIVELSQEIHTEDRFTTNQKILTSQSDTKSSEKTTESLSEDQSVLVDPSEVVSISENPSGEFKEGKPQISDNNTESDLGEQQTHLKSTELEPECAIYDSRSETGMDVSIEAISEEQVTVELSQEIHTEDSFTTNQKILTSQSDTKSSEKTTESLSEDQSVLVDPSEVVSISENPSGEFKEGKPQISDNDTESDLGEQQTHLKSTELEPECANYDSRSETGMDVSIEAISEEQVIVELTQEIHNEDSFTTNQKIFTSQSDTKSSEKTTDSLSEDQSVLVDPSEVVSISENPSGEFKEGKPQISDNNTESDLGEQQTHLKSTELEPECAIYDSRSETGMDVSIEAISEEQVIVELSQEIHTEDSFTTNQKILTSQSDTKSSEKTTHSLSEDQSVLVDPSEVVSISENPSGEFKEGKPQISDNDTESDLGEQQTHLKSTELEPECANYDSRSETGMDVSIEAISEEQVIVELTQEIHTEDSFTTNQKILTSQSDTKSSEKTTESLSEDQSVLVDPSEVVSISENPSGEFLASEELLDDIPIPASHVEIEHISETVSQGCFNTIMEESQLSKQVDVEVSESDGEKTAGSLQIIGGEIYLDEHSTNENNFHLDSSKGSTGEFTFEDTLINEIEIVSSTETVSKDCTLSQIEDGYKQEAQSKNEEIKDNSEIPMPRKDMESPIHLYDSPEIDRIIEKYSNIRDLGLVNIDEPLDLSISQSIIQKNLIENDDKKIVDEAANTLLLLAVSEEHKNISPRIETKTISKRTVQRKKQSPNKFDGSKVINKRVTRSQTTKPMYLSSFSSTDVLAIKSYSPTANKICTQKLSDFSFTCEESNDSESNKLIIDEDVCSKSTENDQTVEAVQMKENEGSSVPESNVYGFQGEANTTADTVDDNLHFLSRSNTAVPATTSETERKPSQFPVAGQQPHFSSSESLDDSNNKFYSSRFKTPGQRKLYSAGPNLYVNIQRIGEHDTPINEDFSEFVIKSQRRPDEKQSIDVDELPLAERIRSESNNKHSKKRKESIENVKNVGISSSSNEHISVPIETYPVIQQNLQAGEQCDKQCDESKQSESEIKNYYLLPKLRETKKKTIWNPKKNTVSPTAEKLMKKLYNLEPPLSIDQTKTEKRSEGVKVLIVDEKSENDNLTKSSEVSASLEVSSSISNLKKNEVELKLDMFQLTQKIISSTVSTEKPRVEKLVVSPDNQMFTIGNNEGKIIDEKVRASKDPMTTPRRKKGGRRNIVSANSELCSSSKTLSDVISESVCQKICDSPTTKQNTQSNQLEKTMGKMEQNDLGSELTTGNCSENPERAILLSGPETSIVDRVMTLDNIKEIGQSNSSNQSPKEYDSYNNEKSIVKCCINLMALNEFGGTKEEVYTSEKNRHKIEAFEKTLKTKSRNEENNQITVGENIRSNSIETLRGKSKVEHPKKCDESKSKFLTSERKKSQLDSSKSADTEKVSSSSKSTSKSKENRHSEKTDLVETERNKKGHKSEEKKRCPITQHVKRKSQIKLANCPATISEGTNETFASHQSLKKNDSKDKNEIITEKKVETKKDKSRRLNGKSDQFQRVGDEELEANFENNIDIQRSTNRRERSCVPSSSICEEIIVSDVIEDERREKKRRKSSSDSKSTPYENKKVSSDKKSKKPVELSGSNRRKSRSKSTSVENLISNNKDIESCRTKILSSTDKDITKSDKRCEERKRNSGLYSKAIYYDHKEASSKTKSSNPIPKSKKDTRGPSNSERKTSHQENRKSRKARVENKSEKPVFLPKIDKNDDKEQKKTNSEPPNLKLATLNPVNHIMEAVLLDHSENIAKMEDHQVPICESGERVLSVKLTQSAFGTPDKDPNSTTNIHKNEKSFETEQLFDTSIKKKNPGEEKCTSSNSNSRSRTPTKNDEKEETTGGESLSTVSEGLNYCQLSMTDEANIANIPIYNNQACIEIVSSSVDIISGKTSEHELKIEDCHVHLISQSVSSTDDLNEKIPAERIKSNSVHPNIQNESENIYKLDESSQISSSLTSSTTIETSSGNDNQEMDDDIVLAKFQTEPLMKVKLTNISSPISHSSTNEKESSSRKPEENISESSIVHDEESRTISSTKIESPKSSMGSTIDETPAKEESNTLSKLSEPTSTDNDRHSEVSEINASNISSFDSQDVLHSKSQCKKDENEQKLISISRSRVDKSMKRKTNKGSSELLVVDNEEFREIFPDTPYEKNIEVAYSVDAESTIGKHSENIIEEMKDGREVVEKHEDSDIISKNDPLSQRRYMEEKKMKKRKSMNVYKENLSRPILVEKQELQNVRILGPIQSDDFTEGSHINTENDINTNNKKLKISSEDSISLMVENECKTDEVDATSTEGLYSPNSKIDLQNESEFHNENINQSYNSEEHTADSNELRISTENKETDFEHYRESLDTTPEKSFDTIHQEIHGDALKVKQKEMSDVLSIEKEIPVCTQTETIVDEMKIGSSISKIENTQDDSTILISSIVNQNKVAINQGECGNFDSKTIISESTAKQTDSPTPEYSLISDNVNDSCKIPEEFHVNYAINFAENLINDVPDQSKGLNEAADADISIIKTPSNAEVIINELERINKNRTKKDSDGDLKIKEYVVDTFETMGESTPQTNECQRITSEDFFKGRSSDISDDIIERPVVDTDINEIPIIMQVNPTEPFKCSTLPISFEKRDIESIENLLNRSKEEENIGSESTVDFSELRDKNNIFTTISSINPVSTVGFLPFVRPDRQLKDTNSVTLDAVTTHENLQMEIGHSTSSCQLEPKEEIIKIDIPEIDSEVVISSDESSRLQSKAELLPYIYPSSSDAMPLRQLENCDRQMYAAQDKSLSACFSCVPSTVLESSVFRQSISKENKEVVPYMNLDMEAAPKPASSCINDPANLSDTCMSEFLDKVNETSSIRVQTSSVLQTSRMHNSSFDQDNSSLIPANFTSQNSEFAVNSRLSNMSSMASRGVSIVSKITTITSRESMLVYNKQGRGGVTDIPLDAVQVQISRSSRFFSRVAGSRNEIGGIPEGYHRLTVIKVSNDEDHTYSHNNTADPVMGGSIDGEDNYFPRSLTEISPELNPNDNPLPLEFRDLDEYKLNEFNESTIKNLSMMAHLKEDDIFDVSSDKKESEELPDIGKQTEESNDHEELYCTTEPRTNILPLDPWQQIIGNDDCQQKVVVVPNDQYLPQFFSMPEEIDCTTGSSINSPVEPNDRCSTPMPIFNISHGDIKASGYCSPDSKTKPAEINNETPSLSKESSTSVSPSDMKSSNADRKEPGHSSKDKSKKSDKLKKSQKSDELKKSQRREKCEQSQQNVLPIRKYSKTSPAKWIRNPNAVSNTKTQNPTKKDVIPESISTDNLLRLPLSKAVYNESITAKSCTEMASLKKDSSKVVKIPDFSYLPESSPLISDASVPIPSSPGKTNPSLSKNETLQNPSPNKKELTSSLILNNILCPTSSPTANSRDIRNFLAPRDKSNNIQIESSEETERKSIPKMVDSVKKQTEKATKLPCKAEDLLNSLSTRALESEAIVAKLHTTPITSSKKASPNVASTIGSSYPPKTSPLISDTSHPISSFPGKVIPSLHKNQELENTHPPEKVNQKGSSLLLNNILCSSTGSRDVRSVLARRPNPQDENSEETERKPSKKKTEETTKPASKTEVSVNDYIDIVKLRTRKSTNRYESAKPTNTKRKRTPPRRSSPKSISISQPMVKTYQSREGPVTVTTESDYPLRLRLKVGDKYAKTNPQPASRRPSDYSTTPDRAGRMGTKRPSSVNDEKQTKMRKLESSCTSSLDHISDRLKDEGNTNMYFSKTSDKFYDRTQKTASRTKVVQSPLIRKEPSRDSASCRMEGDTQKGDFKGRCSGNYRGYPYPSHMNERTDSSYYRYPSVRGGMSQPTHYPGPNPSHPVNAHRGHHQQHSMRPESFRSYLRGAPPTRPPPSQSYRSSGTGGAPNPAAESPDQSRYTAKRGSTVQNCPKFGNSEGEPDWIKNINKRVDKNYLDPTVGMAQQFGHWRGDISFLGAAATVFGSANKLPKKSDKSRTESDDEEGGDGDGEYDPHYEPIVPLPDAIVVTTGEENETALFNERAKLFRFDATNKEWKERGVGQIKILHHPQNNTYRLLMRREQVYKVVLNQLIVPSLEIQPMLKSDKAWMWAGYNYKDEDNSLEKLAVRFKNTELARKFHKVITETIQKVAEIQNNSKSLPTSVLNYEVENVSSEDPNRLDTAEDYDNEDYEDDEEEDDDDDRSVMFMNRCTLSELDNGTWKQVTMGDLQVYYDQELYAARIAVNDDSGNVLSNTLIGINTIMDINKKECTWKAVEWANGGLNWRTLKATFSSENAAQEFHCNYVEGVNYAQKISVSRNKTIK